MMDITAGPGSDDALADEHRRLLEAEAVGRVGSWEMDVATGAVTWSRGLLELYGINPESFDGNYEAALECIHPDDREKVYAAVDANRAGRSGYVRYRVTRRDDGALRWIDGRGRAMYRDGQVVRLGGAIADVTEQVEALAEAAAASLLQQAAFTASPDTISVWDLDSRAILWANRSITDLLGYSGSDVAAMGPDLAGHLVHPDDTPRFADSLAAVRAAADGQVVQVDFRMRHRDEGDRWFSRRYAPLQRDDRGCVTKIVGVTRDTTSGVAVEAALQESEALFRQLAQSVDVAFLIRSLPPASFLYVSPGYEKIFGYDPVAEGETPLESLRHIHPQDYEQFVAKYWPQSESGIAATHDYRILRPDGEVRWVRAKTAPIDDPDVRLRRSASTVEDITVVRHAEAARRDATDAVERANTAKSQFFSRTSHELRTPLNAVLGFGQLLELDPLTADQQNAVQHILRGGRHLVALIDDLLDISKIEGGRLETSVEDVLLTGLLTDVVQAMTAPARAVGVRLSYRSPEAHERPVRADHRRMRQVMINLVSNGINFNRPGGSVDITCRKVGDFVEIDVRDTGRGISADSIPRLFTTFDRLDADSAGVPGTGIALALSHRLMQVMGGGLEVRRSQIGIGSTFTVSVPLAATPTEVVAADVPAAEVSAEPTGG